MRRSNEANQPKENLPMRLMKVYFAMMLAVAVFALTAIPPASVKAKSGAQPPQVERVVAQPAESETARNAADIFTSEASPPGTMSRATTMLGDNVETVLLTRSQRKAPPRHVQRT